MIITQRDMINKLLDNVNYYAVIIRFIGKNFYIDDCYYTCYIYLTIYLLHHNN